MVSRTDSPSRRTGRPRARAPLVLHAGPAGEDDQVIPIRQGATISAPWGPRNTILLYVVTTVVGVGISVFARFVLDLVPPDRVSWEGAGLAVGAMLVGAIIGLLVNQWSDHRRRGRGTIAAACPRTFAGTLSLSPDALVLEPTGIIRRRRAAHVVRRDEVSKVQIRRTTLLQEELSVTFSDGSVACWYAPGWGSATGAFADAVRRMVSPRPGEEHAPAGVRS